MKGTTSHPLTYTRFYAVDDERSSRKAVNKAFRAYSKRMHEQVMAHLGLQDTGLRFKKASFLTNMVVSYTLVDRVDYSYMTLHNVGELSEGFHGNANFAELQDGWGLPEIDFDLGTRMIMNATKNIPNMLVYRGIDREYFEAAKQCVGGFFIQSGKIIPVEELGCSTYRKIEKNFIHESSVESHVEPAGTSNASQYRLPGSAGEPVTKRVLDELY